MILPLAGRSGPRRFDDDHLVGAGVVRKELVTVLGDEDRVLDVVALVVALLQAAVLDAHHHPLFDHPGLAGAGDGAFVDG